MVYSLYYEGQSHTHVVTCAREINRLLHCTCTYCKRSLSDDLRVDMYMTRAATAVAVGSPGVVCAALPTVEVHCVLDSESSDLRWMVELRMYVCM